MKSADEQQRNFEMQQERDAKLRETIENIRKDLRKLFADTRTKIVELGNAFDEAYGYPNDKTFICDEVKNALKEEIAEGLISSTTVVTYCLPEWKDPERSESGRKGGEKSSSPLTANGGRNLISQYAGRGGSVAGLAKAGDPDKAVRRRLERLNKYTYGLQQKFNKARDMLKTANSEKKDLESELHQRQTSLDQWTTVLHKAKEKAKRCPAGCEACKYLMSNVDE